MQFERKEAVIEDLRVDEDGLFWPKWTVDVVGRLFEFKEDFREILNEFYDTKSSKKQLNEMAQTAIFDIPRFFYIGNNGRFEEENIRKELETSRVFWTIAVLRLLIYCEPNFLEFLQIVYLNDIIKDIVFTRIGRRTIIILSKWLMSRIGVLIVVIIHKRDRQEQHL